MAGENDGSENPGGAGAGAGAGAPGAGGDGDGAAKGAAKPTAADIAARSGGAFKPKPASAAGVGAQDAGDDGIDPASKPKPGANGKGARPDHVPEKFWNKETGAVNADDLAKAYSTLESNYTALKGSKGVAAGEIGEKAEDYLPEGIKWEEGKRPDRVGEFEVNDPALNALRKVALKLKVSKEFAHGFATEFLQELNPHLPVAQTEADIIKELGEGGDALRDQLRIWMEGHYDRGVWSEDELEFAFDRFGSSARGVRLLAKLREEAGEKPIPIPSGGLGDGSLPSTEEWYGMQRDPRYKSDEAFRNKVEALGEKLFGTEPAGTAPAGVGIPPQRGFVRKERATTHR